MSGGSYDYLYGRVEDMAAELVSRRPTPLRYAFAKHLKLVAKAMHDIEWVDSGDCGYGDEDEAIKAALGKGVWQSAVVEELREQATALSRQIEELVADGAAKPTKTG